MRTVLFIAPFLLEATLKFVRAAATLDGVRLVVLTQDQPEKVPRGALHWRVEDGTSVDNLVFHARQVARRYGGIHRIIGILENIQEEIAAVREALGVPGTNVLTAQRCRDKSLMKTVLREAGLPCARHLLLRSSADAATFVAQVGFPMVLKPPAGAGCKATVRVNTPADLERELAEMRPSAQNPVLAEEFMTGDELSFDTVTLHGQVMFYNVLRYLPGPLHVLENDWIQWCVIADRDLDRPDLDPIRTVGPAVLRTLGVHTSFTHMEWFRRPDGTPAVSEIGARPPGAQFTSLMSYVTDRDMYRVWARTVADEVFDGPLPRKYSAGAAYLRGPGQGRVVSVEGVADAQRRVGELVVEAKLPEIGAMKSTSYEGDGYVIVRHPDTAVVERALRTVIETIRVRYG